ncbi:MAG: transposase domain-containing protein [Verrucomicrobiales bacterium]|nr:transposase domain-containing protein [Verrucomicrobiales bacterium]
MESCRRRGSEPFTYPRDVLTRLPDMTIQRIMDVTTESRANQLHHDHRPKAP